MGLLDPILGGSEGSSRSYVDPTQSPYLESGYAYAQDIYTNPSPFIAEAQNLLAERGRAGSPYNAAAGRELMATLGGEYLPGGKLFGDYLGAMYNQIRPNIDSQFAGGGRYGSGLHMIGLEDRIADVGMGAYQQERDRMGEAMRYAPTLAGQDYTDIQALLGAGNIPWDQLAKYMGIIGPPTVLNEQSYSSYPGLGSLIGVNYNIT